MSVPGVQVVAVFAGIHVRTDFVPVTNALITAPINTNGYGDIADSGNFPETVDHLSVTDSKFGWLRMQS